MNGVLAVCRAELHRVLALKPAFAVMILGVLIYSVFYPQPYLNEALRDVPIAVVDADHTHASRDFIRRVDATPDAAVALVLPDLPSAERAVQMRSVHGILVVPRDFERDLLHGRPAPVALYADASYFLMYSRIAGGVAAVARSFGAEVEAARLVGLGVDPVLAQAAGDPMPLTAVSLFNPQGGYASYVLPAAFVLILQQTLLIGVGLLGTLPGNDPTASPAALVAGRLLAYLLLEAGIILFYLVCLPFLYGVPRLGSVGEILFVALPFVLAVGGLGIVAARIFRDPLTVQLALAAVGLPFFFLAGFAWPADAMPEAIRHAALVVPSTAAIDALVRIGQLGAPLSAVREQVLVLWGLAFAYGGAAVMLEAARRRRGLRTA